jgi:uncharacterized membrane protein
VISQRHGDRPTRGVRRRRLRDRGDALILTVDVPCDGCDLQAQPIHAWPSYAAYAVSFLTIGIIWANHHTLMSQIAKVDRMFLMITFCSS